MKRLMLVLALTLFLGGCAGGAYIVVDSTSTHTAYRSSTIV